MKKRISFYFTLELFMGPGNRIKEIRKSMRLTQSQFGQILGMKWYKIKDLESGRLKLTEDIAKKINDEFAINYIWILHGENTKEKIWIEPHIASGPGFDIDDLKLNSVLEKVKMQSDAKRNKGPRHIHGKKNKLEYPIKVYVRFHNPRVTIAAIKRAEGKCEMCGAPAPFKRASDGSPYLEIHHIKALSLDGQDTLDNIIVVCPNCHRKIHFG